MTDTDTVLPPRAITTVAVVGAGYMGTGILQVLASAGLVCTFSDVDAPTARAAHEACLRQTGEYEALGYFSSAQASAIRENSGWAASLRDAVAAADLVVEAVNEDPDTKRTLLGHIDEAAPAHAVLATNTSSIPIADLAGVLRRPERLYGMHWFNPAQFMPCVEVIAGAGAVESSTAALMDLLRRAHREPVLVADSPGFVANRLQFALFREAALMVEEGLVTPDRLDEVVRGSFGFRLPFFGPFAIADMAGLDVYSAVFDILERTLGSRFSCPPGLRRLVDDGRLGAKSGAGYAEFDDVRRRAMVGRRERAYAAMAGVLVTLDQEQEEVAPT